MICVSSIRVNQSNLCYLWHGLIRSLPMKFRDHLNLTHDTVIEFLEVRSGNPIFMMFGATHRVDFVASEKHHPARQSEARNANPETASFVFQSRAICVAYCSVSTG